MKMARKKIPMGIDDFEKIRLGDFYYVDKTDMIKELLESSAKVTLFTRPRKFGKSLNMSMLKSFFEIGGRKELFNGLSIEKETDLCEEYMGKFPVVSISLKGINAECYKDALEMVVNAVNLETMRFQHLLKSERLTDYEKEFLYKLLQADMEEGTLCSSLKILSALLEKHYNRKVILLIDAYDMPLVQAFEQGYYGPMIILMESLLEQVLKTNDSLKFAVLTGSMRIINRSIFARLNNLRVLSVSDVRFNKYFGFTEREVKELLGYYGLSEHYETVKEWYAGYQFGNEEACCPCDIINHCAALCVDPETFPRNYWSNANGNDILRRLIRKSDNGTIKHEIERLVAGKAIQKEIHQRFLYQEMYDTIDNMWSVLFTTGYLAQRGKAERNSISLKIPNMEIRETFKEQIMDFFKEDIRKNSKDVNNFCNALKEGNVEEVENKFKAYLHRIIYIENTFDNKVLEENFYQDIFLELLGTQDTWTVSCNREKNANIFIQLDHGEKGIMVEMKYAEDGNLDEACRKALDQIEKKRYDGEVQENGNRDILKYGISFYKKRCKVLLADKSS